MVRRKKPYLSVVHHKVSPPVYTPEEIAGLNDQAIRLKKHIEILEQEVILKKAELDGLKSVIGKK